jgi:hypothetical protein
MTLIARGRERPRRKLNHLRQGGRIFLQSQCIVRAGSEPARTHTAGIMHRIWDVSTEIPSI